MNLLTRNDYWKFQEQVNDDNDPSEHLSLSTYTGHEHPTTVFIKIGLKDFQVREDPFSLLKNLNSREF